MSELLQASQIEVYFGIEAYHQNSITNAMNKKHTHAYMITTVEDRHNRLDLNRNGISPLEVFLGHKEEIVMKDHHTWGCP
eukprot:4773485-Ditylum_brightwellii.AAC.1